MSSAGVDGLVSYLVSQRTREIAIRAEIGPQQRSLYWLVSRQPVVSTCLGVAVGLTAAVALAGLLTPFTVIGWLDLPILAGIATLHLAIRAGRDMSPRPPRVPTRRHAGARHELIKRLRTARCYTHDHAESLCVRRCPSSFLSQNSEHIDTKRLNVRS
jgi:hypothetical protein